MSWHMAWEGRATDFIPEFLETRGKPGPIAQIAKDTIWEMVQSIGTKSSAAWVTVSVNGWEDPDHTDRGQIALSLSVLDEPGEIQKKISEQQPVDLGPAA